MIEAVPRPGSKVALHPFRIDHFILNPLEPNFAQYHERYPF